MRTSSWNIIKVIDLENISTLFESNLEQYNKLKQIIDSNSESRKELMGLEIQVDSFTDLSRDRLRQILPSARVKRGILNPLGSIVKIITGNLDNNDAIKFNSVIDNLKHKEISVENKVTLMQRAFDKLVNVSDDINFNVKHLDYKTKQLENIQKYETKHFNIMSMMNSMYQILNNFRTIYNIIQEIETAIAFSKLSTLHQSVINSTELFNILIEIEKHATLTYPVSKENLLNIERSIELKSYISNSRLTFVLEIPLIEKNTYIYYKVVPIPIYNPDTHQTFAIIPKYPYLMMNRLTLRPIARYCEEMEENKFICTEDDIVQQPTATCIEQLMLLRDNLANCNQQLIKTEEQVIQKITSDHWLLYTQKSTVLTETCGDEATKHNLEGTFILTPNKHCETKIDSIIIKAVTNSTVTIYNLPPVMLPELQIETQRDDNEVDLRGVDFGDIRDILNSVKFNSENNNSDFFMDYRVSVWTIVLYVIAFTIGLSYLSFKLYCIFFKRNYLKPTKPPSDNFSLGEGGVKGDDSPNISFVSKN